MDSSLLGFRLECRLSVPVREQDDDEEVVTHIHADVMADDDQGATTKIGELKALLVPTTTLDGELLDLFEVCDAESQELVDFHAQVFTAKSKLRRGINLDQAPEGRLFNPILYLQSLRLDEAYRKKGLGLKILRSFVQQFEVGCSMVALEAAPLRPSYNAPMDEKWQQGAKRLAAYWAKLGFKAAGGRYMYRDPAYNMPRPLDAEAA